MLVCSDKVQIEELLDFYGDSLQKSLASDLSAISVRQLPTKLSVAASLLNLYLFSPEVAYVWGGDLAYAQLDIYRPYMANSNRKSVVICKGLKGKKVEDFAPKGVPVFHYEDGFSPHTFLTTCSRLHTGIYTSNKVENAKYLRENPNMIHVLGLHGDSDKPSTVTRLSSLFDYVLAADENATRRVLNAGLQFTADRVLVVGGSPIDGVNAISRPTEIKNVVYAPTWEGYAALGNFSSLASLVPMLKDNIDRGGAVRFRPHPGTGSQDKSYKAIAKELKDMTKGQSKVADFNWSDILFADVSGVVSEYLYSRKPIVIPIDSEDQKIHDYITATSLPEYCYLWDFRKISLSDFLASIADDPMWPKRLEKREKMFFGAETQAEVTAIYETKIDLCEAVWSNRLMQKGQPPKIGQQGKAAFDLPSDGTLADLARSVMSGQTMLVLPNE